MIELYKVVLTLSALFFIISICLGWIAYPVLLKKHLKRRINISPKTPIRNLKQSFASPFEYGIHVFNVSNPLEVQNGGKPSVQDIGPFVFDEFKNKNNFEENEEEDTVSFNIRNTFVFRPDKSNGLTGEELITIPHPIIQTIGILVKRRNPDTINVISEGLNLVFKNASAFITAPFMDLFFRGITFDCSHEHYAAKAVCELFETGSVKGATKLNDTKFIFSLMGESNHTDAGRFIFLRGQKNSRDLGKVLEIDGKRMPNIWFAFECNEMSGTDGSLFSPFFYPYDGLLTYSPEICRSMAPTFSGIENHADILVARFSMDFGDIKNEPEKKCLCLSFPTVCPLKTTMDLYPCTKTPMIASMPHFVHGDKRLLQKVNGLHPIYSQHASHVDVEIISQTPFSVYKRIQFNLDVKPVAEISGMENLQELVMPMFWTDESLNSLPEFTDELKTMLRTIRLIGNVKFITFIASFVLFIIGIYLLNAHKMQQQISPVN